MKSSRIPWIVGAIATLLVIAIPLYFFLPQKSSKAEDAWSNVPTKPIHTDHTGLYKTALETGEDVTNACLECHPGSAQEVMATSHWTWKNGPYEMEGHDEPVYGGKSELINNFCIGTTGNEPPCTSCHVGYGWEDDSFDFTQEEAVDCLVCHDTSGAYVKGLAGNPAESVDLLAVAESVGITTRDTCGSCHFKGGGGDAVKHGDLDNSLLHPSDDLDVHMGKYDFSCTDCHRTEHHDIAGKSISVSMDDENQVYCTDCHSLDVHDDDRLNDHTGTVACQTCHIPEFARKEATKTEWLWSKAGQDLPDNPHEYLKIKGQFVYEKNIVPTYAWYSGTADRYILGDEIDPTVPTVMNLPHGSVDDPEAKIFPFKVHNADQVYDTVYNYLLQPKTFGEGGYWTDFDWDLANQLGSEAVGMEYSGEYDFAPTEMYWPTTHMVSPKKDSLQCSDCHTENDEPGRLDWEALGYDGDPMYYGSREQQLGVEPVSMKEWK